MGQTLTHGIYLPDEGERNCYNGLAANWSILDGAVGTIAEHTTALAGKAPASHTHGNLTNDGKIGTTANVPLITGTDGVVQAGSFGNAANTFCEGNDSRLSDARTPVAHTHGRADITDLFNSANTWTGTNSFSIGNLEVQTEYTLGTLPQAESAAALFTGRTTDNNFVTNINFYQSPTRGTGLRFTIRNKWDNNGYSTTGTTRNAHFEFLQNIDKKAYLQWEGYVNNSLYPLANNSYDLGSSSYKWKTLNGINPGALSLPSSSYDPISTQNWIKRPSNSDGGFMCNIVPSVNGWICIQVTREKDFGVWVVGTFRQAFRAVQTSATTYIAMICFPALASSSINIYTNSVETDDADLTFNIARIYPCLGNV